LALDFHPGSVAPADPRCISYTFVRATPSGGSPTIGFRAKILVIYSVLWCTWCVISQPYTSPSPSTLLADSQPKRKRESETHNQSISNPVSTCANKFELDRPCVVVVVIEKQEEFPSGYSGRCR